MTSIANPPRRRKAGLERAFGVVRVSRAKDDARSPGDQRKRIVAACKTDGLELVEVVEELDVSGGRPLEKRPGLLRAVEAVEAGAAEVVIVAYFDRLVRSLNVQHELVDRIEAAGGRVHTVDVGAVSNGTASQWLSSTFLGAVNEYHRRATAERTADSKRDAVARGVAPFARIPPGLRPREEDRVLEHDPKTAPHARRAFELRAEGKTLSDVRDYLREHGVDVTTSGARSLLQSELYLGVLRFGPHVNERAVAPIVDAALWRRVQTMRVTKGRYAKSERLLARLGLVRCSSCGSRLVVGTRRYQAGRNPQERSFYSYRCPGRKVDCRRPVSVAAELVEAEVVAATRRELAAASGRASIGDQVDAARARRDAAEAERDAAVLAFAGIGGGAVRERLLELQAAVDTAEDELDELSTAAGPTLIRSLDDWDTFELDEKRRLILIAIADVVVAPAGELVGAARLTITPRESLG